MNKEVRICQNCKIQFTIEPEDFSFYEKIKVPAPTFCPECRMVRRMTWRNERSLYHRACAATGKKVISMFSPEAPVTVYERDYWWSDTWDQLASGRDYDFSKPFFVQFQELLKTAPLPNVANSNCPGSEYGNHNLDCRNCYLISASMGSENILYGRGVIHSRDSVDCDSVLNVERCYDDILCGDLHKVYFSYDSDESFDSAFLQACKNVSDCLGCINLQKRSYHIFNKPYAKEDYKKERSKYDFGSYKALQSFKQQFKEFIVQYPRRYGFVVQSTNTTGDNVISAKNCKHIFDAFGGIENVSYVAHAKALKDSYDGYGLGMGELIYEGIDTGLSLSRTKATIFVHSSHDIEYAYACHNSQYLFGCIGLRSKQYCILNKQYTKEEYEALVPKIIAHMQSMPYKDEWGRIYGYGDFFPEAISPFAYNETIAQEFFPITREKAMKREYRWKDTPKQDHGITKRVVDIPDHINDVSDSIVNDVLECAHKGECNEKCTGAFRIIPQELQFYRQEHIALPRLCPNCRHFERFTKRNPMRLHHRTCDCGGIGSKNGVYRNLAPHVHETVACPNEFETTYAPDRPEMIYCQQCYNAEVV